MHVLELHNIEESICKTLVACVQDACGDMIKTDIQSNRLKTQNSKPTRIWDLLNTVVCERLPHFNCIADKTKRGNWELIIFYDTQTQIVFTLMRESRFKELCKMSNDKRKWHYLRVLTCTLNSDLVALDKQVAMDFIQTDGEDDLVALRKIVQSILQDINVSMDIVRHHALVLFHTVGFEVQSIRCAMVDGDLDTVDQANWNNYLVVSDSTVSDIVTAKESVFNNPDQGLRLTKKAQRRKGQKTDLPYKKEEEQKKPGE